MNQKPRIAQCVSAVSFVQSAWQQIQTLKECYIKNELSCNIYLNKYEFVRLTNVGLNLSYVLIYLTILFKVILVF